MFIWYRIFELDWNDWFVPFGWIKHPWFELKRMLDCLVNEANHRVSKRVRVVNVGDVIRLGNRENLREPSLEEFVSFNYLICSVTACPVSITESICNREGQVRITKLVWCRYRIDTETAIFEASMNSFLIVTAAIVGVNSVDVVVSSFVMLRRIAFIVMLDTLLNDPWYPTYWKNFRQVMRCPSLRPGAFGKVQFVWRVRLVAVGTHSDFSSIIIIRYLFMTNSRVEEKRLYSIWVFGRKDRA